VICITTLTFILKCHQPLRFLLERCCGATVYRIALTFAGDGETGRGPVGASSVHDLDDQLGVSGGVAVAEHAVDQHGRAILLDVVVEPDAVARPGQNIGQRRADFERIVHVVTVLLDHWNRLILARVPLPWHKGREIMSGADRASRSALVGETEARRHVANNPLSVVANTLAWLVALRACLFGLFSERTRSRPRT
jgi:hypothetical protein